MSLIVVGSMAIDEIGTPFGDSGRIVGGAGTYIAYAASHFANNIQLVSVYGYDFPKEEIKDLEARGIDMSGVEIAPDRKNFYWKGKYHLDMNARDTLVTELNVLGDFEPKLPESYQGAEFLMLGNLGPSVQKSAINQLKVRPKLIVLDTMNFWMDVALEELLETLKLIDVIIINDSEARQLSGEFSIVKAAKKILKMGPKYLVIKKGEHGALLFNEKEVFFAPALPLDEIFDPTGAGDSFAGGFIGYLDKTKNISFENMKSAIIMGSVTASFCVEKFGVQRLKEITKKDIEERTQEFVQLVNFDIALG